MTLIFAIISIDTITKGYYRRYLFLIAMRYYCPGHTIKINKNAYETKRRTQPNPQPENPCCF